MNTDQIAHTAAMAKLALGLDADDPRYLELVSAVQGARTVDDLPEWAREAVEEKT